MLEKILFLAALICRIVTVTCRKVSVVEIDDATGVASSEENHHNGLDF